MANVTERELLELLVTKCLGIHPLIIQFQDGMKFKWKTLGAELSENDAQIAEGTDARNVNKDLQ